MAAFDYSVNTEPHSSLKWVIESRSPGEALCVPENPVRISDTMPTVAIDTGAARFEIQKSGALSIRRIQCNRTEALCGPSRSVMIDDKGLQYEARINQYSVERHNAMCCILCLEGDFVQGGLKHGLKFKSRFHFYSGTGTVRLDFTVWNPRAAHHIGGAWDLGDDKSMLIRDLRLVFPVNPAVGQKKIYRTEPQAQPRPFENDVLIYQDSSGGDRWKSKNHVNRNGEMPLTFRGFEVSASGGVLDRGHRATPILSFEGEGVHLTCTLPYFWQNFPKGIACDDQGLEVHLFPGRFADLHEIQGGEQKTHSIYLSVGCVGGDGSNLDWVHDPLWVFLDPAVYQKAGFTPGIIPYDQVADDDVYAGYQKYITQAVKGGRTFAKRRELINEYGWRHFGDLYADHEAVFYKGDDGFISHYNNQYDSIKGALFQYMRTGERVWWQLAREMAWHVAEIDIYRTERDRYQFNSGLFWHTDHHLEAQTATHRTISVKNRDKIDPRFFGGGPSYQHTYSTGFCYCYWMTGEALFRDAALHMVRYAENGIDGPDTFTEYGLVIARRIKNRLRSVNGTEPYELNGPGRGSGNLLNTMVDAYLLTSDLRYLKKAGRLIRDCVAPDDDVPSRDLLNAEMRWMYTIFLQALGRYIETARTCESFRNDYAYARDTLVHYARWMLDHETPYLDNPDILEFPNETWAAQDIRKADILAIASSLCSDGLRDALLEKSRYFFEKSMEHLKRFGEDSFLTRPLVVMLCNGFAHMEHSMIMGGSSKEVQNSVHSGSVRFNYSLMSVVACEIRTLFRILRKTSWRKELSLIKSRLRSL